MAHAAAAAGTITLKVEELAGSHPPIPDYMYLITRDDTNSPDLGDPKCRKASNPDLSGRMRLGLHRGHPGRHRRGDPHPG